MKMYDKLILLRKMNGLSQEQLADKLGIARQTVSKWENGQAVPELSGLIQLSDLYGVTIDRIVKEDDDCNLVLQHEGNLDLNEVVPFLLRAKQHSYAGKGDMVEGCRPESHDYRYQEDGLLYYDTFLGGQKFAGEEAVWVNEKPAWCMNYVGRIIADHFNGDFLKEALYHVPEDMPYRGPAIFTKGDYCYHCSVTGEFLWYQGYEQIFYQEEMIYECHYHGGEIC